MPAFGDDMLQVTIGQRGGAKIALRWHLHPSPCAELDPLHLALAEVVDMPDTEGAGDRVAQAITDIRDRAAARGDQHLRATIDVRVDLDDHRITLRGPGLAWGRRSRR